jgi:hypothetical protein
LRIHIEAIVEFGIDRVDRVVVAFSMLDHLGCLHCQSKTGDKVQLAEGVLLRYVHRPRLVRWWIEGIRNIMEVGYQLGARGRAAVDELIFAGLRH